MRFRGRPILGAICGLFFGVFVGFDLIMFKVISSGSPVVLVLPILFLVLGIIGALFPPFGRGRVRAKGGGVTPAMAVPSGAPSPPPPPPSPDGT